MTKIEKTKIKITKEQIVLVLIFILVLASRLALVLSQKDFDYEAYDALRQAEHVKETGVPLFKDSLSYSGRTMIFPPLFFYVLAGFSIFIPLELAAKLLTSIAFSAVVFVVYIIAKGLTKNKTASLVAAFFSGFVPIIYTTLTQISLYSLSLPLILLLSYTFLRVEEKGYATLSIILTILLLLINSSVFILFIAFPIYFIMLRLEKQKLNKREVEIALFLFFLALWFNLLLYKKAFFIHGIRFIWQNIPSPLLSAYFSDISLIGIIYAVGVISLLLGVYAIYHVSFKTKNQAATLYISFAFVSFIMLWFKLIPFREGLLFLSMNLIILSAYSIKMILVSISKTKKPGLSQVFVVLIIALFVLTTLTPFVVSAKTQQTQIPPKTDIEALKWLRNNSAEDTVVLGRVEEGFLITYFANRKNIADQNFLLINKIDQRYKDINLLFTLRLKSEAIRLINTYDIDYIFLSTQSMKEYNLTKPYYIDQDCFERVYAQGAMIYRFLGCEVD